MAEFCSRCTPLIRIPDILLPLERIKLKKGEQINFVCEGCNNRGMYKDEDGRTFLIKLIDKEFKLIPYRRWFTYI